MPQTKLSSILAALLLALSTGLFAADQHPGAWVEAESGRGVPTLSPTDDANASGGKRTQWFGRGSWAAWDIDVPAGVDPAFFYLRYSLTGALSCAMDLKIGPAGIQDPADKRLKAAGHLQPPVTENGAYQWASIALPGLKAGRYTVMLTRAAITSAADSDALLDQVGIAADPQRGRWLPGNQVNAGKLTGEGSLRPALELDPLLGTAVGNLFAGDKVLGAKAKPLEYKLNIHLWGPNHDAAAVISTELFNDHEAAIKQPDTTVKLSPGVGKEVTLKLKAPGYGWYGVRVTVKALGESATREAAFSVIHPTVQGERRGSLFGLNLGFSDEDLKVGQLMGVKWRRMIPETETLIVAPARGKWWTPAQIQAARDGYKKWKDAGILSLGFVSYSPQWNTLEDPLGRPIDRHENRPKDIGVEADIVYHLIEPLHDLVQDWEQWNEPWIHSWTWRTGTSQDYRDMQKQIWDKVKPTMPEVNLIGGGSTAYERDVVYAKGSRDAGYVDGAISHPYGIPSGYQAARAAVEVAMNKLWSKTQGRAGLWVTELATPESQFPKLSLQESRYQGARALAPLYLLNLLGAGDAPIHVFYYSGNYFQTDEFAFWNHEKDGTMAGHVSPKPLVAAYSAMTSFLEDGKLRGDLLKDSKLGWALHFTKPDGSSVVAFWPETGHDGQISLLAKDWKAYDYMGRPMGQVADGRLSFPIKTWETCYLVSAQPAAEAAQVLAQARFSHLDPLAINVRSFAEAVRPGAKLRVKIENLLPVDADVRLTLKPAEGLTLKTSEARVAGLKSGESRTVAFEVASATVSPINRYSIGVQAEANGLPQSGTQVVQAAFASYGSPRIDGKLADWANVVPVTMLSRGSSDLMKLMMNPGLTKDLMDGKGNTETAVYKLWTQWDEKNLYVAAEIPDMALVTHSTFQDDPYSFPWDGDCLQLLFHAVDQNPDNLLAGHAQANKGFNFDADYEFAAVLARYTGDGPWYDKKPDWAGDLSKAKHVPQLDRLRAPGTNCQTWYPTNAVSTPPLGAMDASPEGGKEGQVQVIYDEARHVLVYELAIPWDQIPELGKRVTALKAHDGLLANFAFAVGDAGGKGKTYWQEEAGDVEVSSYGFSPAWGGGNPETGGRVATDWGFVR